MQSQVKQEWPIVVDMAAEIIEELLPNGGTMDMSQWCDVWHECCIPLERLLRQELRRRGFMLEPWDGELS